MEFKHLFSPIKLGRVELKNRIVMPPMHTFTADKDGFLTERAKDYYEARAKGGAGLIIVEAATVNAVRKFYPNTLGLYDDCFIQEWEDLAKRVHVHGAKLATQILDPGPNSGRKFGGIAVGPSPVWARDIRETPHELSCDEIKGIIDDYAEAVKRARAAGLDAVEIHAAHSYSMIGAFLSSIFNKRTDEYGGSLHQRTRLLTDIIKASKKRAGDDFPIIIRISGDDRVICGRTIQETQFIAPIIEDAGADALEISSGAVPEAFWAVVPPAGSPQAMNADLSEAVKKVVEIPIISVGRINTPQVAEFVIRSKKADMVSMGRALIADPDLPGKAAAGQIDDIVPCIGDNEGCFMGHPERGIVSCTMNPSRCREKEASVGPAVKKKKVMIIGGGPAGLEAARVASLRGHEVLLFEKDNKLGGQINIACVPPFKQEFSLMIQYLRGQIEKQGVSVELNAFVDESLVRNVAPDAVIIATGAEPFVPADIPGIENGCVTTAWDVLKGKSAVNANDILIIGGGAVGCETADFISHPSEKYPVRRRNVTIVEMTDNLAEDMAIQPRQLLMQRLYDKDIRLFTGVSIKEIHSNRVVIDRNGEKIDIDRIDQVVLAMGAKSVETLSASVGNTVKEVYVIGDAKRPRRALFAIDEGRETGRLL
ncbi:MAG: FAD-dependent oxidoreductase [Desulfobacterales bacterium]